VKLQTRIVLAALATFLLGAVVVLVTGGVIQSHVEARFREATISGNEVLWEKIVFSQFNLMASSVTDLTRNRAALQALHQADRPGLAESATPTYNRLSAASVLTKLQMTDLNGTVWFSAPQAFLGKTEKDLVFKAVREGKVQRGIARDDDGELVALFVFPLYVSGKPVGIGVFARSLQDALDDFKRYNKSEVFLLNPHGAAEGGTDPALLTRLKLDVPRLGSPSFHITTLDSKVYAVVVSPVSKAVGQPQAHLVSVNDYTESYTQQQRIRMVSYAVIAGVVLVSLVGLSWYMRRTFRPLYAAIAAMNALAAHDQETLTHSLGRVGMHTLHGLTRKHTPDEIGELILAFQRMLDKRQRVEDENSRLLVQAQAANQAKSTFLANMSHELRTPLHVILSFADFGLEKVGTAPAEKLRDYFARIDQSGKVLLTLVNTLLDLAKLEAGKMTFEFELTALSVLLTAVADEFTSLVAARHLTIHLLPLAEVPAVLLDATKIMQVLRNLLSNAVKFSPDGGTITISMHREGQSVVVAIRDQGRGVPAEELETIFDKFIQSSRTKTGAGGTGLGLSICREIIAAHKGRLWAENAPEGGAVFFFALPLPTPDETRAAPVLLGAPGEA
jgi:signal transduction histidine kinase